MMKLLALMRYLLFKTYYIRILRKKRVYIPFSVSMDDGSTFEGSNHVKRNSNIKGTRLGFGTYVGESCNLHSCFIGRFCSIANDIRIIISNHPTNMVSTHPSFHNGKHPVMKKLGLSFNLSYGGINHTAVKNYSVEIGSDVWIGEGVRIISGVKIGDGAIIGAGAIVTKDIPDYAICVGVPAKVIKYRFEPEKIKMIKDSQWWMLDVEDIRKKQSLFLDVDLFLKEKL